MITEAENGPCWISQHQFLIKVNNYCEVIALNSNKNLCNLVSGKSWRWQVQGDVRAWPDHRLRLLTAGQHCNSTNGPQNSDDHFSGNDDSFKSCNLEHDWQWLPEIIQIFIRIHLSYDWLRQAHGQMICTGDKTARKLSSRRRTQFSFLQKTMQAKTSW